MLLTLGINRIARESGRCLAQDLQRQLIKPRQALLLEIGLGQCLYPLSQGTSQ
jgi:hypothetical protein